MYLRLAQVIYFVLLVQYCSSITITNHLKIALIESDPFCIRNSNGTATGFLVDLIQELLHRVNTSGTQTVTYETYWVPVDNGSSEVDMWNIVRRHLLSGEADVALVPLVDTTGWNGVIQMSQPFLLTPFLPLISKAASGIQATGGASVLDKIRQGKIKALFVNGSSAAGLIDHDNHIPIKNLRESIQGNDSRVSTYAEGVSRVKNQPGRVALFGEELRLRQFVLTEEKCDLIVDWESIVSIGAYTLPISLYVQNQPLLSSINMNLLRMRQDGTIALLKSTWWPSPVDSSCRQSDTAIAGFWGTLENYF